MSRKNNFDRSRNLSHRRSYYFFSTLRIIITLSICCSCLFPSNKGNNKSRTVGRTGVKRNANDSSALNFGYGRILRSNPIILSGNAKYTAGSDLAGLLTTEPDFITNNPKLEGACGSLDGVYRITDCYKVLKDKSSSPLLSSNGKWGFDANSSEFLQVHTFAHATKTINFFQEMVSYAYARANPSGLSGGGKYPTSISPTLYTTGGFWAETALTIYSQCVQEAGVAFFQPSSFLVCFGQDPELKNFILSQDPDVIYHEIGHALVKIMINIRNVAAGSTVTERTDLGVLYYDEGGSINEGLADFFTYMISGGKRDGRKTDAGKTHFAEWALGRYYGASRPMTEEDSLHINGLSKDDDSRLSYPTFLSYDPNNSTDPFEDIHYAGQITSHFLVSLVEELKTTCSIDHDTASKNVLYVIMETLSEMGDLTSKATHNPSDGVSSDRVNFTQANTSNSALSLLWTRAINPMNYRRFFQTFARFFIKIFSDTNPSVTCSSTSTYNQDRLEKLLDKYGLLLFKSYNDNGNGAITGHQGTLTRVTPSNRQRSTLIPKEHLKMNPNTNASQAFVFDNQEDMLKIIANLQANGDISTSLSSLIPSTLAYNNANGKISPGEILGIALNVYNNSNSIMGGVQILANDWDHGKVTDEGQLKPCNNLSDIFPLETEGAAPLATSTPVAGDCEYITRTNGGDSNSAGTAKEVLMPICLVQLRTTIDTQWVSQEKFRDSIGLSATKCLQGSGSPNDCFIRIIPGAEQSYYSKINPKSTWGETLSTAASAPNFQSSNLVIMEVNPWIPPGTTFDCRFRARFTNCEDCWTDPSLSTAGLTSSYLDDYLDYEYSGGRPFKILHLQFTVID